MADPDRAAAIARWQRALEDAFSASDGVVGSSILFPVMNQEENCGTQIVQKYRGHRILYDSFFQLFGDTLLAVVAIINSGGWPHNKPNYVGTVLSFLELFRVARAADVLAVRGYPVYAYSILRSLKEQAFGIAGVILGYTTVPSLLKYHPAQSSDPQVQKSFRERLKDEKILRDQLIGRESSLSKEAVAQLQLWDRLFNAQVHGSHLALAIELERWINQHRGPFTLGPEPNEMADALYLNRSTELAWMVTRMLPFLQLSENSLGRKWAEHWKLADESFRFMVVSLEKKISSSFIEFLDSKLPLNPKSYYIERT